MFFTLLPDTLFGGRVVSFSFTKKCTRVFARGNSDVPLRWIVCLHLIDCFRKFSATFYEVDVRFRNLSDFLGEVVC